VNKENLVEEKKWKSGDLVRLKSGGPTMTVDRYVHPYDTCGGLDKSERVVKCVWFQEYLGNAGVCMSTGPCHCEVSDDALIDAEPKPVVVQDVDVEVKS
jgi:uncharacterized protein YodC (DUF2158 family)